MSDKDSTNREAVLIEWLAFIIVPVIVIGAGYWMWGWIGLVLAFVLLSLLMGMMS
jgi:hypothetical protein